MIPAKKDEWIAALRSGLYPQGIQSLRHKIDGQVRYCCLGVLCDINQSAHAQWVEDAFNFEGVTDSGVVPREMSVALGMASENPMVDLGNFRDRDGHHYFALSLAEMNDNGFTHAQIADVIEYFL